MLYPDAPVMGALINALMDLNDKLVPDPQFCCCEFKTAEDQAKAWIFS